MAASSKTDAGEPQSYTTMDRGEVEAIGAHCQFGECNQLDFLPFYCQSCKATYCLDHRTETAHQCRHAGACVKARHANELRSSTSKPSILLTPQALAQPCAHPQCRTTVNTPLHTGVHCPTCNRQYCLKHRLYEDHACKTLVPLDARSASSTPAALNADKAKLAFSRFRAWGKEKQTTLLPKPKPTSNAARLVALNNLKKTAKGDAKLPPERRVYLHVEASADTTTAKFPTGDFFYSKEWSVGRLLDAAAKALQVQNVNNQGKGEAEKLRVFHVEGGRLLDFGEKVEKCLVNGNTVVLLRGVGPPVPDLIQV